MGYAVFGGCFYECYALATGRVPTITKLVHKHRVYPGVELAVWAGLLWLWHHLLREGLKPSGSSPPFGSLIPGVKV